MIADVAHSAISMNPNLKEVYKKKTLKPNFKTRRKFSKIRKSIKNKRKS